MIRIKKFYKFHIVGSYNGTSWNMEEKFKQHYKTKK